MLSHAVIYSGATLFIIYDYVKVMAEPPTQTTGQHQNAQTELFDATKLIVKNYEDVRHELNLLRSAVKGLRDYESDLKASEIVNVVPDVSLVLSATDRCIEILNESFSKNRICEETVLNALSYYRNLIAGILHAVKKLENDLEKKIQTLHTMQTQLLPTEEEEAELSEMRISSARHAARFNEAKEFSERENYLFQRTKERAQCERHIVSCQNLGRVLNVCLSEIGDPLHALDLIITTVDGFESQRKNRQQSTRDACEGLLQELKKAIDKTPSGDFQEITVCVKRAKANFLSSWSNAVNSRFDKHLLDIQILGSLFTGRHVGDLYLDHPSINCMGARCVFALNFAEIQDCIKIVEEFINDETDLNDLHTRQNLYTRQQEAQKSLYRVREYLICLSRLTTDSEHLSISRA